MMAFAADQGQGKSSAPSVHDKTANPLNKKGCKKKA
jgi:hypothetical protein